MGRTANVKQAVHREVARIGQALANERRLDIIDMLAQAPRSVDVLAEICGMSIANTSQHLQVLRQAHLVESERAGTRVVYRLAGDAVVELWVGLVRAAQLQLPEVAEIDRRLDATTSREDLVARRDILAMLKRGDAILLDVRPTDEFSAGHLRGALSIPIEALPERLGELPRRKLIVTYCRGTYCMSADEALDILRAHGYRAVRLEGGWPEWRAEGRPIAVAPRVARS
jgi:rhodanese-related sulfurtransferase